MSFSKEDMIIHYLIQYFRFIELIVELQLYLVLENFSTHYYSTEYLGNKDKKNYFEIGKCK